jgi:hypothetical protein
VIETAEMLVGRLRKDYEIEEMVRPVGRADRKEEIEPFSFYSLLF